MSEYRRWELDTKFGKINRQLIELEETNVILQKYIEFKLDKGEYERFKEFMKLSNEFTEGGM